MKPVQFLCHPTCSTCKKARAWLDLQGIDFVERSIVSENPSAEELRSWHLKSGVGIRKLFNTSGTVYRELQVKNQLDAGMSDEEAYALLATNGMLVKRPILITQDYALFGFKKEDWAKKLLE